MSVAALILPLKALVRRKAAAAAADHEHIGENGAGEDPLLYMTQHVSLVTSFASLTLFRKLQAGT